MAHYGVLFSHKEECHWQKKMDGIGIDIKI
jgi:hypothetical protein